MSAAYKFANEVLPLMLSDMAQGVPPAPSNYSNPAPKQPLPQGPTAATTPALQPAAPLQPHVPAAPPAQQKAARFETQLVALAEERLRDKEANLAAFGRGAMNFGRGALSVAKPVIGGIRGGLPGVGKGIVNAGKTIYKGGPAAAAGAATALYGGYKSLRSPIVEDGEGIRLQSPVRIPDVRFRSPVTMGRGAVTRGVRIQNPVVSLW